MKPSPFVEYEKRSTFAEAKRLAYSLATKYQCETKVCREGALWMVMVPNEQVDLLNSDKADYRQQREQEEDYERQNLVEDYKEALVTLAEWEEEDDERAAREEADGDEIECPKCSGFGKIPMAGVCPRCKGEGWI